MSKRDQLEITGQVRAQAAKSGIRDSKALNRGYFIASTAMEESNTWQQFLSRIGSAKLKPDEALAALSYIRKLDDRTHGKLKIWKGEEGHHIFGYSEFMGSIANLGEDDQVKAFQYMTDHGFDTGTTTRNIGPGYFDKTRHRGTGTNLTAHFNTGGRNIPNNKPPALTFDEWVGDFKSRVEPQAIVGLGIGKVGSNPRLNAVFDALDKSPKTDEIATKYGVTKQDVLQAIFNRGVDQQSGNPTAATKAAKELMISPEMGKINEKYSKIPSTQTKVLEGLDDAGINVDSIDKNTMLPIPDKDIYKPGTEGGDVINKLSIGDRLKKFASNPKNLGKAALAGAAGLTALKPSPVDAAQALTPEVVDEYHTKGWWEGTKQLGINTAKELASGLPGLLAIGGATAAAPGATAAALTAAGPVLAGLAIAGTAKAAGKAYSRHLEHTTGSGLRAHYERYKYVNGPTTNGYKPRPRRTDYTPRPVSGPLQIKQDDRNGIQQWWDANPVVERVTEATRAFDPNKGDFGITELTHGRTTPADRYENGSTSVRIRPNR